MTTKEKAEAYVRQALPELMELSFGCEVKHYGMANKVVYVFPPSPTGEASFRTQWNDVLMVKDCEIIGHPIQLQHWLRVFENIGTRHHYYLNLDGELIHIHLDNHVHTMWFNLTTGQPDTEQDYEALCNIFGI